MIALKIFDSETILIFNLSKERTDLQLIQASLCILNLSVNNKILY